MTEFRVACIQNTATRDIQANVDRVCARIDEAVANRAVFIALPETVGLIEPVNAQIPAATYSEAEDVGLGAFRARARQHEVMLLVGSQLILEGGRIYNRSFLLDKAGEIRARYNKLHMFDIELKNGEVSSKPSSGGSGFRSVTTCALARFTAHWPGPAPNSLPFRRHSPRPPGRRTGTRW
jgi:predicted amidohydrolase